MNNNENMNDLIKKAQKMIENNQIPPEIKEFAQKISSKEPTTQSNSSKNFNNNLNPDNIQKMLQMATAVSNQTSDDDMSKLLFALKPYLRNEKKEKIDEYIKLIKMGKIAKLIDNMNNNTT